MDEAAPRWCPSCEPGRDPTQEVLDLHYCGPHDPLRSGLRTGLDDQLGEFTLLIGEAGDSDNRLMCDLLHRGKKLWRPRKS